MSPFVTSFSDLIGALGSNDTIVHIELEGILMTETHLKEEIQSILDSRISGDELTELMQRVSADDPTLEGM